MCRFCLLTSIEMILMPDCGLLYLHSGQFEKFLLDKKVIAISIKSALDQLNYLHVNVAVFCVHMLTCPWQLVKEVWHTVCAKVAALW